MPEPLIPIPTPQTQAFWDGTARGELMIQRSVESGQHFFYPRGVVPGHVHETFEWVAASGRGKLVSYVINRRPMPGFENESPVIALVELNEGPRLMTNIIDSEPDEKHLPIGAPVEVVFKPRGPVQLPFFKIVEDPS